MHILTKYTLKQLVLNFILILLGLIVLIWLTQSLKMIDMMVSKGVPVELFLKMTGLILPNFIQILSPIALFAVILFVYSAMQSNKEIMVMQAIGMKNSTIMKPVMILTLILTGLCYGLSLKLVPESISALNELKFAVKNDISHLLLQPGQFNSFNNGTTLYIKEHKSNGLITGIVAYQPGEKGASSILIAKSGTIYQEPTGFKILFHNGTRQDYNKKTNQFSILKFEKYTLVIDDTHKETTSRNVEAGEFSFHQLLTATPSDFKNLKAYRKAKLEAIKRITKPLYNITFAFLAMLAILTPFYNRQGQIKRMNLVILSALIIQSFALGIESLIAKNLNFIYLLPLNILGPIIVVYLLVGQGYKMRFRQLFSKKMVIFLCLVLSIPAQASLRLNTNVDIDKNAPVDFEADTFTYLNKTNQVIATGDVIINQNGTVLSSNELIFDKNTNTITFDYPLTITLPDGTTTSAKTSYFSNNLLSGVANDVQTVLYEGSLIKAEKLTRKNNGKQVDFKNIAYTPCTECAPDLPLWEISANRLIEKIDEKEMVFKHAFLKVKSVPIFYFPYLAIPDFSVKRKTGFLMPAFSHSTEMEQGITTPFFIDINESQNLTISPTFSATHTPLVLMDYDGIFQKAALSVDLSGTQDNSGDNQGHIKAKLRYDIDDKWRLDAQYYHVSSDTYFRRYDLPDVNTSDPYLKSHLTIERFGVHNYFNFKGYSYQSLYSGLDDKTIPDFIPTLTYKYVSQPLTNTGLSAYTTLSSALYNNEESFSSNRVSGTVGVVQPYHSNWGLVVETKGSVRVDGYDIDSGDKGYDDIAADNQYTVGRFYPVGSVKVSFPMAKISPSATHIIEPIAMLISSPTNSNKSDIPNVDSLDINFDDTNLFSENRFSGYDKVETGTRANYGFQYMLNQGKNKSMSFLFGQSYRFSGDEVMDAVLGSDSHYSDFVGRWGINYGYLSLNYRFTLDKNNFSPIKNEIAVSAGNNPLRLGVEYTKLDADNASDTTYTNQEEILFFAHSKLTRNWGLSGYYRYNLEKSINGGGPIEMGATAQFDNDCTSIIFDLSKSYTEDGDYEGNTTFMVKFILKTLGGM